MKKDHYTLTSTAGKFIFPKNTLLSHAKLIRDTITASFRGAIPGAPRIDARKAQFAPRWIRENLAGPIAQAGIAFEWDPTGAWSN